MAINNKDILIYQGETKSLIFTITNINGITKDMTNGNAKFVLIKGGETKLEKTIDDGIIINNDKVTILFEEKDTSSKIGQFGYELRLIDTNGISIVSAIGNITILKSNTIK